MNVRLLLLFLVATAPLASRGRQETSPPLRNGPAPAHNAAPAPANPGAAATNTAPEDNILDQIAFDDVPLDEAITQLARMARINIKIDPALLNQKAADGTAVPLPRVKERWRNVTARQALQALLYNNGWQMELVPEPVPNRAEVLIRARKPNSADPPITKVNLSEKPRPAGDPAAPAVPGDELLEAIAFDKLPLQDAIRQLAVMAGLNIQLDPRLASSLDAKGHPIPAPLVTGRLENVTARQAIQGLLDEYGWQATRISGNPILRIEVKDPRVPDSAELPALPR